MSRKSNKSAKFHVDHDHDHNHDYDRDYDEDQDVVDDDDNIQVDRIANHPAALLPSTARLRRFLDSDDDSDDGVYHREGSKNLFTESANFFEDERMIFEDAVYFRSRSEMGGSVDRGVSSLVSPHSSAANAGLTRGLSRSLKSVTRDLKSGHTSILYRLYF